MSKVWVCYFLMLPKIHIQSIISVLFLWIKTSLAYSPFCIIKILNFHQFGRVLPERDTNFKPGLVSVHDCFSGCVKENNIN